MAENITTREEVMDKNNLPASAQETLRRAAEIKARAQEAEIERFQLDPEWAEARISELEARCRELEAGCAALRELVQKYAKTVWPSGMATCRECKGLDGLHDDGCKVHAALAAEDHPGERMAAERTTMLAALKRALMRFELLAVGNTSATPEAGIEDIRGVLDALEGNDAE